MQVSEKGQVTIPKHIRLAAGVTPGSEVAFSLDGSKIAYVRTMPSSQGPFNQIFICDVPQ